MICVVIIYLILTIFSQYKDREDLKKLGATPSPVTDQTKHLRTKSKAQKNIFLQYLIDLDKVHSMTHGNDYDDDDENSKIFIN